MPFFVVLRQICTFIFKDQCFYHLHFTPHQKETHFDMLPPCQKATLAGILQLYQKTTNPNCHELVDTCSYGILTPVVMILV